MKTLSIFLTALFLFSCAPSDEQNTQHGAQAAKQTFNRDSLITFIKAERDTLIKYTETPFTPSIAGTLHFNRFKLYQKHSHYWEEYNFYPDVQPVLKEYNEALKRAMANNFPQIRKSYIMELQRNGNYKDIKFDAIGIRNETLFVTSRRFEDTVAMRALHERLKPQAEKYRFEQMQYFGGEKPFLVNVKPVPDDSVIFLQ